MNTSPRSRHAFTLVELLVVITIIGILAGLITAAAIQSRGAAKRAVIKMEIEQLAMALEHYKTEYGEYPPDFFGLQHSESDVQTAAMRTVLNHIRKRFPRYSLSNASIAAAWNQFRTDVSDSTYGYPSLDVNRLDSAASLVFWLGGLPADPATDMTPAGFNQDPEHPFRKGGSRTESLFEFNLERYVPYEESYSGGTIRYFRYYPAGSSVVGNSLATQSLQDEQAPYVYFRSSRVAAAGGRYEYGYSYADGSNTLIAPACYVHRPTATTAIKNVAVPYLDGPPASNTLTSLKDANTIRRWRNLQKFQIICAGLDGHFGDITNNPSSDVDLHRFRCSRSGENFSEGGQDFDNLTNFAEGTLEDEMQ